MPVSVLKLLGNRVFASRLYYVLLLVVLASSSSRAGEPRTGTYLETDGREVPVAFDVDVLVLGGTGAAVAAAQEARKAGAETLLLAPYTYLGEDLAATLRLELNPDEKIDDPLATEIYVDPQTDADAPANPYLFLDSRHRLMPEYGIQGHEPDRKRLLYDRNADHKRSRLQSNGDATIFLDFGRPRAFGQISLLSGRHPKNIDYIVDTVSFFQSDDKRYWKPLATDVRVTAPPRGAPWGNAHTFSCGNPVLARYVKIEVRQHPDAQRMLLSELVVFPDRRFGTVRHLPSNDLSRSASGIRQRETAKNLPRPLHVKKVLDEALLRAKVPFLYGTRPTSLLKTRDGRVAGVLVANRAGRQAVLARKIIYAPVDYPYGTMPTGTLEFRVIGGEPVKIKPSKFDWMVGVRVEMVGNPYRGPWPNMAETASDRFPLLRYVFEISDKARESIARRDLRILNRIESDIRSAVYHPDIQFTSDRIFIETRKNSDSRVAALPSSWTVLCEGRPVTGIAAGRLAGEAAAKEAIASRNPESGPFSVTPLPGIPEEAGCSDNQVPEQAKLGEMLDGLKPHESPTKRLAIGPERFPVLGRYEVLVVGGGTSGAPAAIASGRAGAETAVIEYLHEFGGIGTAGAISVYWHGHREGFTAEVLDGKSSWNIRHKMNWWDGQLRRAKVDTFRGALACGTIFEQEGSGRTVRGIMVATVDGPGMILAQNVIDATGNADIAAAADAKTRYAGDDQLAIQGAGLPPLDLGASYTNTDYYFVDENDIFDVMHVFLYGKRKFHDSFDIAKMIGSRERRRVVGDYTLTVRDHINKRTFSDTVMRAASNYDSHGTLTDTAIYFPGTYSRVNVSNVPYRCSLPRGLDGILVAGLGTSADRDAVPLIRMQPDLQNQGYALGYAAATAVRDGVTVRDVDIKKVQKHLVEKGNLPPSVLADRDCFETSRDEIEKIVKNLSGGYEGVSILLGHPEVSRELLRRALETVPENKKIYYASVLAAIGDASGASVLRDEVRRYEKWDDGPGWVRPTRGGHGFRFTELARTILLLGKIRDREAVPLIAEKLSMRRGLGRPTSFRACIQALGWIGDPGAVESLEEFLSLPGRKGNWITVEDVYRTADLHELLRSSENRIEAMHELMAAEALCRCGDPNRIGIDILQHYADDVRGFYSRYASKVLRSLETAQYQ